MTFQHPEAIQYSEAAPELLRTAGLVEECEDHDWQRFPYEDDTNAGGYKECRRCGLQEALTIDDDIGGDYEDHP